MGGYAFGTGGYGRTRAVQSPQISPLGIMLDSGRGGNEPGSVGEIGQNTALTTGTASAQGALGRGTLEAPP